MSIDRQTIIDAILGGGIVPIGVTNSASLGYDANLSSPNYEYNPDEAAALLAASSYGGEEIKISCTSPFQSIALAVSDYANSVGFNTVIDIVEGATLADIRATGDYDAFIVTAMHSSSDPYQYLGFRVQSDAHHSGYSNDELNAYITTGNTSTDLNVREEAYRNANAIIVEHCAPMISLAQLQCVQSIGKGVENIKLYGDGFFNFTYVSHAG